MKRPRMDTPIIFIGVRHMATAMVRGPWQADLAPLKMRRRADDSFGAYGAFLAPVQNPCSLPQMPNTYFPEMRA